MTKMIVCTSIYEVTEAIEKYDTLDDWNLIVVGDLKSPKNYSLKNGIFLNTQDQEQLFPEISSLIGWNCIQRRNIGFLYALKSGATIVASVDDDNIPNNNWGKNIVVGKTTSANEFKSKNGIFDPVAVTNYPFLWHRGFPIQKLNERTYEDLGPQLVTVDIEAAFWNGDPDIDAICRMEHAPNCRFDADPFPFFSRSIAPFNSQNTFLTASALSEYFMFPGVGRMDDIWAAFYLQALGRQVIFTEATVTQKRNDHDLTIDFEKEVLGYVNNHKILAEIIGNPESLKRYVPSDSWRAFELYKTIAKAFIN